MILSNKNNSYYGNWIILKEHKKIFQNKINN